MEADTENSITPHNRDTTQFCQCILSIYNTAALTETPCMFPSVCVSALIVLARRQGHSGSSECTQRRGEIGVDKMRLMPQWRHDRCIPMGPLCRAPAAKRSGTERSDTPSDRRGPLRSHRHNL